MASYTTNLFRDITAKPVTSAGKNLLTDDSHNIGCVGSLTSHRELISMEDIYETGRLRFIMVLIREDLKVKTFIGCNYKSSTFSSVILRPWVLVRPESNSRPPAWQLRWCSTVQLSYQCAVRTANYTDSNTTNCQNNGSFLLMIKALLVVLLA